LEGTRSRLRLKHGGLKQRREDVGGDLDSHSARPARCRRGGVRTDGGGRRGVEGRRLVVGGPWVDERETKGGGNHTHVPGEGNSDRAEQCAELRTFTRCHSFSQCNSSTPASSRIAYAKIGNRRPVQGDLILPHPVTSTAHLLSDPPAASRRCARRARSDAARSRRSYRSTSAYTPSTPKHVQAAARSTTACRGAGAIPHTSDAA
jgi:hypothetical protein